MKKKNACKTRIYVNWKRDRFVRAHFSRKFPTKSVHSCWYYCGFKWIHLGGNGFIQQTIFSSSNQKINNNKNQRQFLNLEFSLNSSKNSKWSSEHGLSTKNNVPTRHLEFHLSRVYCLRSQKFPNWNVVSVAIAGNCTISIWFISNKYLWQKNLLRLKTSCVGLANDSMKSDKFPCAPYIVDKMQSSFCLLLFGLFVRLLAQCTVHSALCLLSDLSSFTLSLAQCVTLLNYMQIHHL